MARIRLAENPPTSTVMWPVLASFAACFVVGFVLAELGVYRTSAGAGVGTGVLFAIVAAGTVTTLVLGRRKMLARVPLHRELEIADGALRLRDAGSGALVCEAAVSSLRVERARYGTDAGTYPMLLLWLPGANLLQIVVLDESLGWPDGGPHRGPPTHFVDPEGWGALVAGLTGTPVR